MTPFQASAAAHQGPLQPVPWEGPTGLRGLGGQGQGEVGPVSVGRWEVAAAEASAGAAVGALASMVSLRAEVPEALLLSMRGFIEAHPNWDQYRLFQAALAGFLVQNGVQSREVTRCYLANMFQR
ncbi:DUF2811 domain-containing protein [Cyanobium sp. Morenito 9A2]|uniref:DUF2811 domain-containing protein n=1 Tax=Cyanobium sp. Morenito 9A2 TaxID=2823718 RepID=UPI0037C058D4